jgi:aspartate 1-decarboxylase
MRRRLLKSKIHRATVTSADLDYVGSLTLSTDLMHAADLVEFEQVHIANVDNGARFVTYVIAGEAGAGVVQLNGAAARLGHPGDLVIVMAFADIDDADVSAFRPAIVQVDGRNRVLGDPADHRG